MSHKVAANVKVFAIGRIFIERPARTNALSKLFAEDKICSLIINVKPELSLSKDLPPIAPMSRPAVANTHVSGSFVCLYLIIYCPGHGKS